MLSSADVGVMLAVCYTTFLALRQTRKNKALADAHMKLRCSMAYDLKANGQSWRHLFTDEELARIDDTTWIDEMIRHGKSA